METIHTLHTPHFILYAPCPFKQFLSSCISMLCHWIIDVLAYTCTRCVRLFMYYCECAKIKFDSGFHVIAVYFCSLCSMSSLNNMKKLRYVIGVLQNRINWPIRIFEYIYHEKCSSIITWHLKKRNEKTKTKTKEKTLPTSISLWIEYKTQNGCQLSAIYFHMKKSLCVDELSRIALLKRPLWSQFVID